MKPVIFLLDTGIVGAITNPKSLNNLSDEQKNCKNWFIEMLEKSQTFALPVFSDLRSVIVDYEVRRELLRANKSQGIKRLDELKSNITYLSLNTDDILLAAQLWAEIRNRGKNYSRRYCFRWRCYSSSTGIIRKVKELFDNSCNN